MKRGIIFVIVLFLTGFCFSVDAQIGKLLKKQVEKKTEKTVGKILNAEPEKTETNEEQKAGTKEAGSTSTVTATQPDTPKNEVMWSKYDFVPGDQIIFEDGLEGEENGEFPSRWDLVRGNAEIAEVNGEMVIMFRDNVPSIVPYFKDPQQDYLPDVFTIEFDLYYPGSGTFEAYLFDTKNQKSGSSSGYTHLDIQSKRMAFGQSSSNYPEGGLPKARWMHVAIAYTNGKLKAYMDDTRLINIPRLDFDPKGFTLYSYHAKNDNLYFVKNVRIAKGGVKYYDRIMQDGKIVANGIRFATGKTDILPESMGIINEIYTLMDEHPDLKLSIEGHTDSVGEEAMNQTLSEKRAGAVKEKLVSMGIDASRLESKGWGETNPVDNNASPEGRANNRRVEFVKM
jgi:OmpA-OmpF porin, OOP family